MIAARWKTKNGTAQHRDPGCRYIRWLNLSIDEAVQQGYVVEMGADEARAQGLPPCGSCFSAAGYKRAPRDLPINLANLDLEGKPGQ